MHQPPLPIPAPSLSRHPVFRTGVTVGASLCVLFLTWLVIANRISFIDRVSLMRNPAAGAAAGILMFVPVWSFMKSPGRLFLSSLVAWTMVAVCYGTIAVRFPAIEVRMGTFHLFVLGAVAYGLLAALIWVARCIAYACQHPVATGRRIH